MKIRANQEIDRVADGQIKAINKIKFSGKIIAPLARSWNWVLMGPEYGTRQKIESERRS